MTKCKFCSNPIDIAARYCAVCHHYQSPWVQGLRYFGAVVIAGSALTAVVLFIINQASELLHSRYGSIGLELVATTSEGDATFINNGERDIFISGIVFECPQQKNYIPLNKTIRGGMLESMESSGEKPRSWQCISGPNAKLVQKGQYMIKNQAYIFFNDDHPQLRAHFDLDDSHAILDGTATVMYHPYGESGFRKLERKCKVMIVQRANANGDYPDFEMTEVPEGAGLINEPKLPPHKTVVPTMKKG